MLKTTYCKFCHKALIFWVLTKSGKNMPLDAAAVNYEPNPDGEVLYTENGAQIRGNVIEQPTPTSHRAYRPHWATCSKAAFIKKYQSKPIKQKADKKVKHAHNGHQEQLSIF